MSKALKRLLLLIGCGAGSVCLPQAATAAAVVLAPHTFVSHSGVDANPCTQASPCLTFQRAYAQTSAGGEIQCLDSGEYGPLSMVSSGAVSIDCRGTNSTVTSSGGDGITVLSSNLTPIFISGLTILTTSAGNGNGISLNVGVGKVHVQDVTIRGFANGIVSQFSSFYSLVLDRVSLIGNSTGLLYDVSATTSNYYVTIRNSVISYNTTNGLRFRITQVQTNLEPTYNVTIDNSEIAQNGNGIAAVSQSSTGPIKLNVSHSAINGNSGYGLVAAGGTVLASVGSSTIAENGTGVSSQSGAGIYSEGNNQLVLNTSNGTFTATVPPQ